MIGSGRMCADTGAVSVMRTPSALSKLRVAGGRGTRFSRPQKGSWATPPSSFARLLPPQHSTTRASRLSVAQTTSNPYAHRRTASLVPSSSSGVPSAEANWLIASQAPTFTRLGLRAALLGANLVVGVAIFAVTLTMCVRGMKGKSGPRYAPVRFKTMDNSDMDDHEQGAARYSDGVGPTRPLL